jgi:hypothetical protein
MRALDRPPTWRSSIAAERRRGAARGAARGLLALGACSRGARRARGGRGGGAARALGAGALVRGRLHRRGHGRARWGTSLSRARWEAIAIAIWVVYGRAAGA